MSNPIHEFSQWLETTHASQVIQEVAWIIPTTQTIHILCIAIVISSIFMIDLRLLGVIARSQATSVVVDRFLPWIWYALIVLLITGAILITGEPGRSLENPAFRAKMIMLVTVIIITLLFRQPLRKDPVYWEQTAGRRAGSKGIAIISILLWTSILFAGRWIAYTGE